MRRWLSVALAITTTTLVAQDNYNNNKFKQLKEELATPNVYRTASGAPGHKYYQQKADYVIDITLDDEKQTIKVRKPSPIKITLQISWITCGFNWIKT